MLTYIFNAVLLYFVLSVIDVAALIVWISKKPIQVDLDKPMTQKEIDDAVTVIAGNMSRVEMVVMRIMIAFCLPAIKLAGAVTNVLSKLGGQLDE